MDIAERGRADPARLAEKHSSSSEGEAQGLLECTPSRNGRLAGSHSGGSSLYARPVSGSSPPNGRLDPDKEDGGSGGVLRRAPLHRDSTESLVFEVETPPANPALASGAAAAAAGRRSVSFLTAVLMGVALCFHSLLEGAAMGAQATIRQDALRAAGIACFLACFWASRGWLAGMPKLACWHQKVPPSVPAPPPPFLPPPQQLAAHLHRHCEPQGAGGIRPGQQHRGL